MTGLLEWALVGQRISNGVREFGFGQSTASVFVDRAKPDFHPENGFGAEVHGQNDGLHALQVSGERDDSRREKLQVSLQLVPVPPAIGCESD